MWMYEDETFHLDTDEGGGGADSSDEAEEEESAEGEEEEEDAEGGAKKGTGPKPGSKRWNKIYARSKLAEQYEGHGTPAEIAQMKARLEMHEQAIEQKEEEGKGDDKETREQKEKAALIRKQLRSYEPDLEHLGALHQHAIDVSESIQARAADTCVELMEESGVEVNERSFEFFRNSLNAIIKGDRRLYLIGLTSPERAVKMAYEEYAKPFQTDGKREKSAALVRQGAALKKLPKQVKSGSSSAPVKKQKEPKDVKEAEGMFLEQFEAAQEE